MNQTAYTTNLAAMGLAHYQPYQSAFDAVPPRGADKPCTVPKKRGPKPNKTKVQQAAMALETPAERKARQQREGAVKALDQQGRATVDLAPRKTGAITIHNRTDAVRNTRIRHGRAI